MTVTTAGILSDASRCRQKRPSQPIMPARCDIDIGAAKRLGRFNIIGERVLGLPRDRDPYADQPFEERPHD